jgi:hypothetical protein
MVSLINNQIQLTTDELLSTFNRLDTTKQKLDFIKSLIDPEMQKDLYDLIEAGATLSEPGFRNMMVTRLASYVTKNALEVFSYRTTSQEIAADKSLKGYREVTHNGKEYVLLAEIDSNIEGARYGQQFESQEEALKEVRDKKNKNKYRDLYDLNGKLKIWEIENGYVPGEYVLSTRVPADDLHSHTLGRLRNRLKSGNFTSLDKESQARSGSDYDGDQRFNQILYKKGKEVPTDDSKEGLYNQFLMLMAEDYSNPENLEKILNPIDTDKFDGIVNKYKKAEDKYEINDPEGLEDARRKNMMGNVMKGILTNLTTVFSFLSKLELGTKESYTFGGLSINGFPKDEYNTMKNTLGILLNLAFDNAKNPKIEIMGLNEITANMYILMLIGNKKLDEIPKEEQDGRIYERLEKISDYFNSPLAKKFIELKRASNTSLFQKTDKEIFEELKEDGKKGTSWNVKAVEDLRQLYYLGQELFEFKSFHYLTQEVPQTTSDFIDSERVVSKFMNNEGRLIDTSNILSEIPAFDQIENIMLLVRNVLFNHTIELSKAGARMLTQIRKDIKGEPKSIKFKNKEGKIEEKYVQPELTKDEIFKIVKGLNDYITFSTLTQIVNEELKATPTIQQLQDSISSKWNDYKKDGIVYKGIKNKYANNKFIEMLQLNENGSIQIREDYRFVQMPQNELNAIREDFNKLKDSFKYTLALYTFSKYGIGTSTYRGGFYNLMSNEFKAELSQHIQQDVNSWISGEVTNFEMKNAKQWIYNVNKGLGEGLDLGTNHKWDINSYPALDISNDSLTEISSFNSMEQLNKLLDPRTKSIFEREFTEYRRMYPSINRAQFAKEMAEKGMGHKLNKGNMKEFLKQELTIQMKKDLDNDYKHCK